MVTHQGQMLTVMYSAEVCGRANQTTDVTIKAGFHSEREEEFSISKSVKLVHFQSVEGSKYSLSLV